MAKFLSAGKTKPRQGKSAVMALSFDSHSVQSSTLASVPENQDRESLGSKRLNPAMDVADFLDSIDEETQEKSPSKSAIQPKRRKVCDAQLQTGVETENGDEVDDVGVKSKQAPSPNPTLSELRDQGEKVARGENPDGKKNTRRSARRSTVNGQRGRRTLTRDDEPTSGVNSGRQQEASLQRKTDSEDEQDTADFSRKDTQCRRLGMRGRVVLREQNTCNLTPQHVSPNSPELSPERRRSHRKPNNVRSVAVTSSSWKPETSPTSPARPDEFPAHAVNGSSGTAVDLDARDAQQSPSKSPLSAQVWDTGCLESPKKCFTAKECYGGLSSAGPTLEGSADADSREPCLEDEFPDSVSPSDAADGESFFLSVKKEKASTIKPQLFEMSPGKNPPSPKATNDAGMPSLVKANGLSSAPLNLDVKCTKMSPHSSRLMIKLQKCDSVCNSPTISASAAMKALKGTNSANFCLLSFSLFVVVVFVLHSPCSRFAICP